MKQIFITIGLFLSLTTFGQSVEQTIVNALKRGDVATLSAKMDSHLEISLLGDDDNYEKSVGAKLLTTFFSQNAPTNCTLAHSGNSNGSQYLIANLTAGGKNYRVYVYFKAGSIQEIRIDQ